MRTTLTLDEDIAVTIERLRRTEQLGLKAIVNRALRFGLRHLETRDEPRAPFRTAEVSLGRCRLGDLVSVSEALAVAEGDVILSLINEPVRDADHFRDLVKDLPSGKSVPLLVQRSGGPTFLAMRVPGDD